MGYHTNYYLLVEENINKMTEDAIEAALSASNVPVSLGEWDEWKWYEHESDMKKASILCSGVTFLLEGEGEDREDIWEKRFKDGKMQVSTTELVRKDFGEWE